MRGLRSAYKQEEAFVLSYHTHDSAVCLYCGMLCILYVYFSRIRDTVFKYILQDQASH